MWYWDFQPAGNYTKKPLTKKQLQKIKEGYEKWAMIAEHVKQLEESEETKAKKEIEEDLQGVYL